MEGVLAKKKSMTQIVTPEGKMLPVTVLEVKPNVVTAVRVSEKGGLAVQLGAGKAKRLAKAQQFLGQFGSPQILREFKAQTDQTFKPGDKVTVAIFQVGDSVDVSGRSKGKGFAGTVKRHGFKRGPKTHGHDHHRQPGSIGAMGIARVLPGRRMAGRMGGEQVTVKNLKVVGLDEKNGTLLLQGSIPGSWGNFVLVKKRRWKTTP